MRKTCLRTLVLLAMIHAGCAGAPPDDAPGAGQARSDDAAKAVEAAKKRARPYGGVWQASDGELTLNEDFTYALKKVGKEVEVGAFLVRDLPKRVKQGDIKPPVVDALLLFAAREQSSVQEFGLQLRDDRLLKAYPVIGTAELGQPVDHSRTR
jgi:hypothetical protein